MQGGIQSWLRAHPYPPVLEHLSFRLGNQLFFVRVVDEDENIMGPGSLQGLMNVAESCKGIPCVLPMKKKFFGGKWVAAEGGWGLLDARNGQPVNPIDWVSDEKIEMTDWELQDFAVQFVKNQLEQSGYLDNPDQIISYLDCYLAQLIRQQNDWPAENVGVLGDLLGLQEPEGG